MRKVLLVAVLLAGWSGSSRVASAAQNSDASADHTAPSYDMKAQSLLDLETMNKKFVDLANALPADKLTWRPSPDARSFAEVFLHVSAERYGILHLMGAETPAGVDRKALEKSTTDRTQIVAELNKSWEFAQKTINGMTNAEFAKLLPKLGPQANAGDVVYILVADAHEHLGQAIAYARENGIVPPGRPRQRRKKRKRKSTQSSRARGEAGSGRCSSTRCRGSFRESKRAHKSRRSVATHQYAPHAPAPPAAALTHTSGVIPVRLL